MSDRHGTDARGAGARRGYDWRHMPEWASLSLAATLFLYAPLVVLIVYACNANQLALVWSGFSLRWFGVALSNESLRQAAVNSLLIAAASAPVATGLAIGCALALERAPRFPLRGGAEALLALPLVIPEIVTAIATLICFHAVGLKAGLGNVILAHIVFCLPFALLPIRAALRNLPRDLDEAARDLYATPLTAFTAVTLPLLLPAIGAGATLAFIVSLDDFLTSLMVAPAGATTLPVYFYSMLRLGVTPEANAAATLLLAVSLTAVTLAFLAARRHAPKDHPDDQII